MQPSVRGAHFAFHTDAWARKATVKMPKRINLLVLHELMHSHTCPINSHVKCTALPPGNTTERGLTRAETNEWDDSVPPCAGGDLQQCNFRATSEAQESVDLTDSQRDPAALVAAQAGAHLTLCKQTVVTSFHEPHLGCGACGA